MYANPVIRVPRYLKYGDVGPQTLAYSPNILILHMYLHISYHDSRHWDVVVHTLSLILWDYVLSVT